MAVALTLRERAVALSLRERAVLLTLKASDVFTESAMAVSAASWAFAALGVDLSTGIAVSAEARAGSYAVAALGLAEAAAVSASAEAASSADGALTTGIAVAATVTARATVAGDLATVAAALSATSTARATASAALTTAIPLAASSTAASVVAVWLGTPKPIVAHAEGGAIVLTEIVADSAPHITYPANEAVLPAPLRVAGTASAGASIAVQSDGVTVTTVTADGDGAWEATGVVLAVGPHSIVAVATPGGESTPVAVTVDAVEMAIEGASIAKAIGNRALLWSRGMLDGVMVPANSGSDPVLARFHYVPYHLSAYWTAERVRAVYDLFRSHIGEFAPLPTAQPNSYDRSISRWWWEPWPDPSKPVPTYVAMAHVHWQQARTFALMAREMPELWVSAYLDNIEATLDAFPRDVDGTLTVDPAWGAYTDAGMHDQYEPAYGEAAPVKTGAGAVWHAWAWSEMQKTAVALGDSTRAALYQTKLDAAIVGLRALKMPSGWYNVASSDPTLRCLVYTAAVAAFGLGTSEEITAAATLIRDSYLNQYTSKDFYRGSLRLLAYPDLYPTGTARWTTAASPTWYEPGIFINGGYWTNYYANWIAQALERVDATAARAFQQDGVDEVLREHRIGNGPWEYLIDPDIHAAPGPYGTYHGAESTNIGGRLIGVTEALPDYVDLALNPGNGYAATHDMLHGHLITRVEVLSTVTETDATVTVYDSPEVNADLEAWPLVSHAFGTESAVASVRLLGVSSAVAGLGIARPSAPSGGRVRAAVTAGSATGNLTVRCHMPKEIAATLVEVDRIASSLVDTFDTNRLIEYWPQPTTGWAVRDGAIILDTTASGAGASLHWAPQFVDGVVKAEIKVAPTVAGQIPAYWLRARRIDVNNLIYVRLMFAAPPSGGAAKWHARYTNVIGGVSTTDWVDMPVQTVGSLYTASLEVRGTTARLRFNGRIAKEWTHTLAQSPGHWGIGAGNDTEVTNKVQFEGLAVVPDTVYDTIQPIPPAHLLEAYDPTLYLYGVDPGRAPKPLLHGEPYVGLMENAVNLRDFITADGAVSATGSGLALAVRYGGAVGDPTAPTITSPAAHAHLTGTSTTVTGIADPGATIRIYGMSTTEIGTTTADGAGNFSVSVPITGATHVLSARAELAGKVTAGLGTPISVETAAPVITSPTESATVEAPITVQGTAAANASVTVKVDGVVAVSGTADGAGAWSVVITSIAAGARSLTAYQTPPGAATSPDSAAVGITVTIAGGLTIKVGRFQVGTSTGNLDVTWTADAHWADGTQPKVVLFFGGRATALATKVNEAPTAIGAMVSGTSRGAYWTSASDGVTNPGNSRSASRAAAYSLYAPAASPTLDGEFDFGAMLANGFRVNRLDAFAGNYYVHYIAIGGTDVGVAMGHAVTPVGTGAQSYSTGFQPTALLTFGAIESASAPPTTGTHTRLSVGVASSAADQAAVSEGGASANPPDASRFAKLGAVYRAISKTAVLASGALQSFDAAGFTINWTAVDATQRGFFWVALRGVQAKVGWLNPPTTNGGTTAVAGLAFAPKGGLFLSQRVGETTATPAGNSTFSIGAAGPDLEQGVHNIYRFDSTNDSVHVERSGLCYVNYSRDSANVFSLYAEGRVSAWNADGFTFETPDGDTSASVYVYYLALGPVA